MYVFNRKNPPLLKHESDILSLPPQLLTEEIGGTEWSTSSESKAEALGVIFFVDVTETKFSARRYLRWVRSSGVEHLVAPRKVTVTEKTGYSETRRQETEAFVSAKISTGGEASFVNAEVTASLKMNDELARSWTQERTVEISEDWEGGATYVTWSLVDCIETTRTITVTRFAGRERKEGVLSGPTVGVNTFEAVIAVYHDKVRDIKRPSMLTYYFGEESVPEFSVQADSDAWYISRLKHPCMKCACPDFIDKSDGICNYFGCAHERADHS